MSDEVGSDPHPETVGRRISSFPTTADALTRDSRQKGTVQASTVDPLHALALFEAQFSHSPDAMFVVGSTRGEAFVFEASNPAHCAGMGRNIAADPKKPAELVLGDLSDLVLPNYFEVARLRSPLVYRETVDTSVAGVTVETTLIPVLSGDRGVSRILGISRHLAFRPAPSHRVTVASDVDVDVGFGTTPLRELDHPSSVEVSRREIEILEKLVLGWSSARIARSFGIAERTVIAHLSNISRKLDTQNRTQTAIRAVTMGLVRLPGDGCTLPRALD